MLRAAPLVLVLLLAACAPAGMGAIETADPQSARAWPPPPLPPRIRSLYAFRDPEDLGLRVPFFTRLWEVVAGAEDRRMVRPYGVAVRDGLIVVTDPGRPAVYRFDMAEKEYRRIETIGDEPLLSPVGVALGPDRIYISDSALERLYVLDREGDHLLTLEGWQRPTGLAYDEQSGRLYVAETLSHRISVIDREGRRLFTFGSRGTDVGEFNYPTHLFLEGDTLYVNDTMNFRLQAFAPDGTYRSSFGSHGDASGDFAQPKGVAADSHGNLYVVDALFDRVQIFNREGRFLLAFGDAGTGFPGLSLPSGCFIAGDRIYVADSYNGRVQVFQFLGAS
jgi:DNA-binding beta-propeller fold protein YncE